MKRRILVIDDDAAVRCAMAKVLEGAGYEVVQAADGEEALERFASSPADLLLLDLAMPRLGGWDVFERLTTRCPLVPVIIITGLPHQHSTASLAGAGALMEKPVDVPALLVTIEKLLAESPEKRLLRISGYLNETQHVAPVGTSDAPKGGKRAHARNPRPAPRGSALRARH